MERLNLDRFKILAAAATLAMFAGTACAETELYGWVNRAIMHTDDGFTGSTLLVDNAFNPSTLGVKSMGHLNKCVMVGGVAELELNNNDSRVVSQLRQADIATNIVLVRRLDTWASAGFWGKLSLGYGDAASYGITRMSYSRTGDTVSHSRVADLAGGMHFNVSGSAGGALVTNPRVDYVFDPVDGIGSFDDTTGFFRQKNRIRWDSEKWCGLGVGVSFGSVPEPAIPASFGATLVANNASTRQYMDVAVRYEGDFSDFLLSAGIAWGQYSQDGRTTEYNNGVAVGLATPLATRGQRLWAGSVAAEHKCTGINAAISYGNKRKMVSSLSNHQAWFFQLGKHFDWTHYGQTNFVIDYFTGKHALRNSDTSKSYSIGVVQDLCKVNSQVYATVRAYKYNTGAATSYDRIWVASAGFLFKFGAML
jgi:hypothetical protein